MSNKRLIRALAFTLALFICSLAFIAGTAFTQARLHTEVIRLPDGTQVTCIASDSGGVSCSWSTDSVAPKDPKNPPSGE